MCVRLFVMWASFWMIDSCTNGEFFRARWNPLHTYSMFVDINTHTEAHLSLCIHINTHTEAHLSPCIHNNTHTEAHLSIAAHQTCTQIVHYTHTSKYTRRITAHSDSNLSISSSNFDPSKSCFLTNTHADLASLSGSHEDLPQLVTLSVLSPLSDRESQTLLPCDGKRSQYQKKNKSGVPALPTVYKSFFPQLLSAWLWQTSLSVYVYIHLHVRTCTQLHNVCIGARVEKGLLMVCMCVYACVCLNSARFSYLYIVQVPLWICTSTFIQFCHTYVHIYHTRVYD